MKLKKDFYRELLVSWLISVIFVYFYPRPDTLLGSLIAGNITHHVMNDDSVIHIGIIVKGVGFGHEKSHQLKYQFVTTYRSILKHAKRKNLHFLIMTDPRSVPYLEKIMRKFAERDRCKCIEVSYDFINTHIITRPYIRAINKIRPYFTSNSQQSRKYTDDLFMMGPFYHRIFPYAKFVMLDADLKFRIDIAELFDHFDHFEKEQIMGVAVDLAPHYRIAFRKYRESHPNSEVGEPGKFQGFNTGIVLYHLQNMRKSQKYNNYVHPETGAEETISLAKHYQYSSHLGDQCLFTLLGMEHPNLFYDLPCAYNFQLDTKIATQKQWRDIFDLYHNCTEEPKIYHGNGGAEIPND